MNIFRIGCRSNLFSSSERVSISSIGNLSDQKINSLRLSRSVAKHTTSTTIQSLKRTMNKVSVKYTPKTEPARDRWFKPSALQETSRNALLIQETKPSLQKRNSTHHDEPPHPKNLISLLRSKKMIAALLHTPRLSKTQIPLQIAPKSSTNNPP